MQARRGSRALALALAPVLWTQGQRVHRGTPVLPEAAGPLTGVCGSGGPCRLLVLGESTAAGVGASDHTSGLAGQLARALAERLGLEVSWQALVRSGYTAQRALSELVPRLEGSLDVIVVTLGVNDVLRLTSRTRWCHDIRALVAALHHHLSLRGRLVLAGAPRVDGMPALPQPTRAVLGLHARSLDTSLARIATPRTTVTHLPLPAFDDPEIFAYDNLHPSPLGYCRWAVLERGVLGNVHHRAEHLHSRPEGVRRAQLFAGLLGARPNPLHLAEIDLVVLSGGTCEDPPVEDEVSADDLVDLCGTSRRGMSCRPEYGAGGGGVRCPSTATRAAARRVRGWRR